MPKVAPRTGYSCAICSRPLTNSKSIQIGIGPICRGHLAKKARDEDMKRCDCRGCLWHPGHAATVLDRARRWIANMAEGAGEPLPDQAEMLLLIRRMDKAIGAVLEAAAPENPACALDQGAFKHLKAPDVVAAGPWALASWLKHQVEPWCWIRHRNLVGEATRMCQHLGNLLELTGSAHEAEELRKIEKANRTGKKYQKRLYRYAQWYPVAREGA